MTKNIIRKKRTSQKALALRYAERGLHVVPFHPQSMLVIVLATTVPMCARPGKHPITRHGVKDATVKRGQIKKWWKASPDANIGIATGSKSGILVLDIDPRNGGDKNLKRLKKELGPLPQTVTALTGLAAVSICCFGIHLSTYARTRPARSLVRASMF